MRMHGTCRKAHEVRGHLGGLLDPFTVFFPKACIFAIILPLKSFKCYFSSFDLAFIQIFRRLLSLSLLKCFEGLLVVNKSHPP
jgi:hypothetical protein